MIRFIHYLTLILFTLLLSFMAWAQNPVEKISISGQIATENPSGTIIYLMTAAEKNLVKTEIPDLNGHFIFSDILKGTYFINATLNGKPVLSGDPFEASSPIDLGILKTPSEINLNEVVVTKAKAYIERQEGKMVLNVENSIASTGSSAFEIVEKAPGISVDNNDNISLRGKSGLIVQIDGKITPMTGANLANYLRGIPSGSIEKIEFITNPSSKYDAAGTSIINIKLKKDKRKGTNGSISTSYGQGKYPKNNNSLSLNHRNEKVTVFGNYNFAYRETFSELRLNRKFYDEGIFTGAYDQVNYFPTTLRNHLARIGADYAVNSKHSLGIVVGGVINHISPNGQNNSDVYDENFSKISRFSTKSNSSENWKNASANLNYKFTIDTTGTALTVDLDYADYGNKIRQNYKTNYFNFDQTPALPEYLLHGDLDGKLQLYSAKTDFMTRLKNKVKLETGLKSSYVKADNDLSFYDRSLGQNVLDPTKSNHFIYKENINAAYANVGRELGKWNFQAGLRVENTNIAGDQLTGNNSFKDNYTQWFPSAFVSYAVNEKNGLEFNYSRRIQRPGYDQLNPFKFYLDPSTYKEGNPYLKPQTTHSFEFTHSLNQKIFTTLSFSRTKDNITENISPSITEPQVTVQTNRNLETVDIYGLYIVYPQQITKWWDTTNNVNFYVGSYSGTLANTTLSKAGNLTWNANSVNNFKFGNGFTAELTGNFQGKERHAFDVIEPIWFIHTGFQKKFQNKSTLKLAFTDVFKSWKVKANVRFTDYNEHFALTRDSRVLTLSYTYNFGNGNAIANRRAGGAEDIKQRAGS